MLAAVPTTLDETFFALRDLVGRRLDPLPADLVAAHVLSMTPGADWPVRRAALEAIVRRKRFAERDGLVVVERPRKKTLGSYVTGRGGDPDARPYETWLTGVAPLRTSCECADFVRSSLGVCKHGLTVLADVLRRGVLDDHLAPDADVVTWRPHLPLHGAVDRLAGLRRARAAGRIPKGWVEVEPPEDPGAAYWERLHPIAAARAPNAPMLRPDPRDLGELARRRGFLSVLVGASLDPAATKVALEEVQRADRRAAALAAAKKAWPRLRSLKRSLYPYQEEGVRAFLERGRLLLADDMGLGKTTQAVAACHALFLGGAVTRGLLVVPAALKSQWAREWRDTSDVPVVAIDGDLRERSAAYDAFRRGFAIVGYEQLLRDFDRIAALEPELVVLDEAQRIKNYASKTAAYVKALTPEWRLVLTGTPMENRFEELASLLDWVDDVALAPVWRLDPWHTIDEGDGGRGRSGARHLDTLRARMSTSVVRRRRAEVLAQLPKRTDTRVPVAMTEQQRAAHDELTIPIAQILSIGKRRPLRQHEFLRLMTLLTTQRIISNGLAQLRFDEVWPTYAHATPDEALLEGLFAPKLVELRTLIADLAVKQERKVVVFSQWRRMLRLAGWSVGDVLAAAGARAAFFTGGEDAKLRARAIVEFHDDPTLRVLFLSDAGGVGLNLQRAASACINLELPWNPAVLEQRIGRIYRLGQKAPIDVFHLVSDYGIETRIAELVGSKQAVFRGLFDGTTDDVRFEGRTSFLADVEKLVAAPPARLVPVAEPERESDGAAAENASEPAAPAAGPANATPDDVRELFARLAVTTTPGGGVRIEAPAETASLLVALLEGAARVLAGAKGVDAGE